MKKLVECVDTPCSRAESGSHRVEEIQNSNKRRVRLSFFSRPRPGPPNVPIQRLGRFDALAMSFARNWSAWGIILCTRVLWPLTLAPTQKAHDA